MFRSKFLERVVKVEMSSSNHTLSPTFHGVNHQEEHSVMIHRAESCAARASFQASSKEERQFSRAGRNVFPSGG